MHSVIDTPVTHAAVFYYSTFSFDTETQWDPVNGGNLVLACWCATTMIIHFYFV